MTQRPQTQPFTIRLTAEEKAFLQDIAGGGSTADGIRVLLAQAQEQAGRPESIEDAQARLIESLGGLPTLRPGCGARSVVVEDLVREASLVVATAAMGPPDGGLEEESARQVFESQLIDRGFDLVETMLRHVMPEQAATWRPRAVRDRFSSTRPTAVAALAAVSKEHLPKGH